MAGNNFYISLFILFLHQLLCTPIVKQTPDPLVFIRGSILFEQVRDTPVTINPPTILFTRRLNFSKIEEAVWQTQTFAKEYKKFCDSLNDKLQTIIVNNKHEKYFVTENEHHIRDAHLICSRQSARLPEIRNYKNFDDLTHLARLRGVRFIPAGITPDYSTNAFRFESDDENAEIAKNIFPSIYYFSNETHGFRNCVVGGRGGYANNPQCLQHFPGSIGMFYSLFEGKWTLNIVPVYRYYNNSYPIICERL